MSTLGLVDKQSAGPSHALEQVLEAVLAASAAVPGGASAAARRGSRAILPAVVSLRELQRTPQLGHWHGLLHRRCRLAPARAGFDEPRAEADERAGWRLVRARVRVGADDAGSAWPRGADVVHDLTRRLGEAHRADAHASARPATPRPPAAGSLAPGSAQGRPRARSARTGRTVLVRARDIAAWADAGGDSNRVHLVPGAARDAGLRADARRRGPARRRPGGGAARSLRRRRPHRGGPPSAATQTGARGRRGGRARPASRRSGDGARRAFLAASTSVTARLNHQLETGAV